MARKEYDGEIAQNVDLAASLVREIDAFCKKSRVKKKAVFELALRRFLAMEAGRVGR
jgi:hypothetical protein